MCASSILGTSLSCPQHVLVMAITLVYLVLLNHLWNVSKPSVACSRDGYDTFLFGFLHKSKQTPKLLRFCYFQVPGFFYRVSHLLHSFLHVRPRRIRATPLSILWGSHGLTMGEATTLLSIFGWSLEVFTGGPGLRGIAGVVATNGGGGGRGEGGAGIECLVYFSSLLLLYTSLSGSGFTVFFLCCLLPIFFDFRWSFLFFVPFLRVFFTFLIDFLLF